MSLILSWLESRNAARMRALVSGLVALGLSFREGSKWPRMLWAPAFVSLVISILLFSRI